MITKNRNKPIKTYYRRINIKSAWKKIINIDSRQPLKLAKPDQIKKYTKWLISNNKNRNVYAGLFLDIKTYMAHLNNLKITFWRAVGENQITAKHLFESKLPHACLEDTL